MNNENELIESVKTVKIDTILAIKKLVCENKNCFIKTKYEWTFKDDDYMHPSFMIKPVCCSDFYERLENEFENGISKINLLIDQYNGSPYQD